MNTIEAKEAATALMATVKHLMTGREIDACEWAKSGEMEGEVSAALKRIEHITRPFDEGAADNFDREEAEESTYREFEEFNVLKRLAIQFSREIANWHDARNRARSRDALMKGAAA